MIWDILQLQCVIYSFFNGREFCVILRRAVNVFALIRLHLSLYVVISVFNEVQCYISAMPFPRDGVSPHKTCIR